MSLWAILVGIDKAANFVLGWTLGGGLQPWGWTISDRLALRKEQGHWVGRMGCALLNVADKQHCRKALSNNPTDELSAERDDHD